jgi:Family of unknown function (DUF6152)
MRFRNFAALSVLAVAASFGMTPASPAYAHHSFAMFDQEKEQTITGVVKEFQWTNPHTWIQLMVEEDGKPVEYSIEGMSPSGLSRRGWKRDAFKPGDKITVVMHPLKSGEKGGSFLRAITSDGAVHTSETY